MNKHRLWRTPLAAVVGLLAVLVVPSIASAHHIDTTASCVLVDNVATVKYDVKFVGFGQGAKDDTTGTVKIDGTTAATQSSINWSSEPGVLSGSKTAGPGTHNVVAAFDWKSGHETDTVKTNSCPTPVPDPGIKIVKDGPSTRYVGDQATFTYKVTNTGNVKLTEPVVTDDKCAPVTKVTQDTSFGPGETWEYTCTTTITDAMGDQLVNVGSVCAEYDKPQGPDVKVCDDDDHKTNIPKPAIVLDKTGAATAAAGSTFTYSFKATNIGNVSLTNVALTDDRCQNTLTRVEPNLADQSFDKGDEWFYTCTVTAPAGPAQVDNLAKVCGVYSAPGVETRTVCDDDPHTFTVPPPGTPPSTPPNSTPNNVPGGGDGGVLPESIASGRASLRGPSGCVKTAFRARVSGRSIASVTFFVDGKKVKTISGKQSVYSIKVRPNRFGFGRHKIVARVEFTPASGTKARKLPLTFRRCAQGTVAPRFTG